MNLDKVLLHTVEENEGNVLPQQESEELGYGFQIIDSLLFSRKTQDVAEHLGRLVALSNTENEHISFYINNYFESFLDIDNFWEEGERESLKHYFDGLNFELIKSLNRTGIALWWNGFTDVLIHSRQYELALDTFADHASQCFNLWYFEKSVDAEELNDSLLSYYVRVLAKIPKAQLVRLFEDGGVRFKETLPRLTKMLVNNYPELIERYFVFDFEGFIQRGLCEGLTEGKDFTDALVNATDEERRFLLSYGFEDNFMKNVF